MNYKKIYDNIVENAKIKSYEGYTEIHHIMPKCLGGTGDSENLIRLSAKEHFLCHLLLAKHYGLCKLWYAFFMMKSNSRNHKRLTGLKFEIYKKKRSESMRGENNPMYGTSGGFNLKIHSEESKEKMRLGKLGKKRAPFTRASPTEETKSKISISNKGQTAWNKGLKYKKVKCPHCQKEGGGGNMTRYHFNNCKHK